MSLYRKRSHIGGQRGFLAVTLCVVARCRLWNLSNNMKRYTRRTYIGKPLSECKLVRKDGRPTKAGLRLLEQQQREAAFREAQQWEAAMSPAERKAYYAECVRLDAQEAHHHERTTSAPLIERLDPTKDLEIE